MPQWPLPNPASKMCRLPKACSEIEAEVAVIIGFRTQRRWELCVHSRQQDIAAQFNAMSPEVCFAGGAHCFNAPRLCSTLHAGCDGCCKDAGQGDGPEHCRLRALLPGHHSKIVGREVSTHILVMLGGDGQAFMDFEAQIPFRLWSGQHDLYS